MYNRTYGSGEFEWDETKERSNFEKHGIEFVDGASVLGDPSAISKRDLGPIDEERFVTIGMDLFGRVLVVVYTHRGEKVRLISARNATKRERREYGEGK